MLNKKCLVYFVWKRTSSSEFLIVKSIETFYRFLAFWLRSSVKKKIMTLRISCNLIMIQESEASHVGGVQLMSE